MESILKPPGTLHMDGRMTGISSREMLLTCLKLYQKLCRNFLWQTQPHRNFVMGREWSNLHSVKTQRV